MITSNLYSMSVKELCARLSVLLVMCAIAVSAKAIIAQPTYMDGAMGYTILFEDGDKFNAGPAETAKFNDPDLNPNNCVPGVYQDETTGEKFLRFQTAGGIPGDVKLSDITKLKITTAEGVELDGGKFDELKNNFPYLNYLNLENCAVKDATVNEGKNALTKLNEISQLKTVVFPAINGLVIPHQTFKNNQTLETAIFPDLESGSYQLEEEAFYNSKLKSVSLGKGFCTDLESHPNNSTSGASVFARCDELSTVVLDDNIRTLGNQMFYHTHSLKYLLLPGELRQVGSLCFKESAIETITIPDHLNIPANTQMFQGCIYLKDIYVEADELRCGYQGLMEMAQTMNFDWQGGKDGAQTFKTSDYKSTSLWHEEGSDWNGRSYTIPILHYVGTEKAKENYRTPAWHHYNGTAPDGTTWPTAGDIAHKETGWSSLEWLQGKDPNITDIYQGYQGQHEWKAFTYPYSDYNDPYVGWRQFMIGGNTLKQQDIFYDNRIKEYRWYTICLPIDMTKAQFESAYGIGAALNEFSGAKYDESKNLITLEFNNPATVDDAGIYLKRHVPYMIHPAKLNLTKRKVLIDGTVAGEVQYKTENGEIMTEEMVAIYGVRSDLFVKWDDRMSDTEIASTISDNEGYLSVNAVTKNLTVSDFNMDYTFVGDYKGAELYGSTKTLGTAAKIPEGAYYLGYTKDKYPLGFYYSSGNQNWVPYCAAILRKDNSSASAGAKANYLNVDMFNESKVEVTPTGIPTINIPVVKTDNKVYNLNGQVVRANADDLTGLQKGIYIVGGKKIMVK